MERSHGDKFGHIYSFMWGEYLQAERILPAIDPGIRYEQCNTNTVTDALRMFCRYVIAIVLAVGLSTRGLYKFTYYTDNVLTTYYRRTENIYIKNCQ